MGSFLTDAERYLRPIPYRDRFRFYLDLQLKLATRVKPYRRWFPSIEARNQYVLDLPTHFTVVNSGEELGDITHA